MPTYDYTCEANGQTVEVMHSMSTTIKTWGQLCKEAELDLGDTPAEAQVTKGLGLGVVGQNDAGPQPGGPCGGSCACHPRG
ncbi:MAG: regulator [Phycisphaerae bacterium]|jgi:predicted nucleic acid-binding Zn ribbon protein|nr:regulator [Phycisphaerae bacterium]